VDQPFRPAALIRLPVLAAGLTLLAGVAALAQQMHRTVAAIDQPFRAAVERKDVPGVVAMAANRHEVLYRGAFGTMDGDHSRPMAEDAIFQIASMTKAVTSVALMQLVEQGRVKLDDPADKYLAEFATLQVFQSFDANTGNYTLRPARVPTVRQLMTHTSGLGYNFTSPIVRDFKPRAGESYVVGPLLFDPGERWLYGTSTDWVGRLVERISRMTLDDYFREHIFRPLGMGDTYFNIPDDKQSRVASAHRRQPDGTLIAQPSRPLQAVTQFNGGGGLRSTAGDYIRFLQMLLNAGTLNGARILKPDTVEAMATNQIGQLGVRALTTAMPAMSEDFTFVNDGRDKWGLGFLITSDRVAGKRAAGSLSWGGLNNTYFWVDRTNGIAGVIMMQFLPFADRKALALYDAFERAVYQAFQRR
jgi:CubicO group peptidase (beta-lactamase class C family)